jgi:hypothetical protein
MKVDRIEDQKALPDKLRRSDVETLYFDSGNDSGVVTLLGNSGKAKVEFEDLDATVIVDLGDRSRIPQIIAEAAKKLGGRRAKQQEPPTAPTP